MRDQNSTITILGETKSKVKPNRCTLTNGEYYMYMKKKGAQRSTIQKKSRGQKALQKKASKKLQSQN